MASNQLDTLDLAPGGNVRPDSQAIQQQQHNWPSAEATTFSLQKGSARLRLRQQGLSIMTIDEFVKEQKWEATIFGAVSMGTNS
jgi:hypothetical protein